MYTMLKTRTVPNVGELVAGEEYPASPLMEQLAAQGFAVKSGAQKAPKKTSTSDDGSTEQ